MSTYSNASELHATSAVNSILSKILPGNKEIKPSKKDNNTKKGKGSGAQLIDHNLKKMVALQKKDIHKIKKKEKINKKNLLKKNLLENKKLEKNAKLEVLQKHKNDDTLTDIEKKYLEKLTQKAIRNAKSWNLDEEEREESLELQEFILKNDNGNKNHVRKNKRRQKVKQFREEIKQGDNVVSDHRYAGLTPGLAPVGLSDEEESSSEEEPDNDDW